MHNVFITFHAACSARLRKKLSNYADLQVHLTFKRVQETVKYQRFSQGMESLLWVRCLNIF